MKRRSDWPEKLFEIFEARKGDPFKWGINDCVMFAADVVQAMTDTDLAEQFRGTYSDEIGAKRLLKGLGGIDSLVSSKLGAPMISPLVAQRGDVVLIESHGDGPSLCIVTGMLAWGPGEEHLVSFPVAGALKAWRV
jgi:hypothetical protein